MQYRAIGELYQSVPAELCLVQMSLFMHVHCNATFSFEITKM